MKIDIHAHVLPGVDDGARAWDSCLRMLAKSARCGVEVVFATPHYIPWEQGASISTIHRLCKEAESKFKEEHGMTINVYPGHEVYYNVEVVDKLKRGEVLTLAGTRYVLVEFKPSAPYQELLRAAREFGDAGYIPIYAHVERYHCLHNLDKMKELKRMGVLFQVNVMSFQGGIFDAESRRAKTYLKTGMIDFLSSDMHNSSDDSMMSEKNLRWIHKNLKPEYQKNILYGNGQRILAEMKR